jgi:hypothetical protein
MNLQIFTLVALFTIELAAAGGARAFLSTTTLTSLRTLRT